ncbi:hypothetical protein DFH08DRAFT_1015117 [Mycena albidolilacea]|uniref:Uncharacterized protein n=1 Tax=Mycena albidolilacea TaxID=1033008 RepID=A0AAD7AN46_9AGAR|nr:hypothetical protein DFH08DRAFT_1015117 [Mycena albidolilacea]
MSPPAPHVRTTCPRNHITSSLPPHVPLHPKSFPHQVHASVRPAAPEIVSGEWLLHADSSTVQLAVLSDRPLAGIRTEPGYFSGGDASTPPTRPFTRHWSALAARATRFYRWHIDTALYDLSPPRIMTLHVLRIPHRLPQVCRYDEGTTAFVAGKTMWVLLPPELESVAVRAHHSTRLGLEYEGLEVELGALPPWEEAQDVAGVTGELVFRVHPCGATELFINSLLEGTACKAVLYPDSAHLTDLQDLPYTMQCPAIAPHVRSLLPLSSAPTNSSPSFPPEAHLPV